MRKFSFLLLSLIFTGSFFAQTADDLLKQKYWNYRERLKKYFIYLDPGTGGGIPNYEHNIGKEGSGVICTPGGHIKEGDGPEAIGMYIATLALEYRNLKNDGRNVGPTLTELYYAFQAINRLDARCEGYLSNNPSLIQTDGRLMRSDADQNFYKTWQDQYAATLDAEDDLSCSRSEAYAYSSTNTSGFNDQNVFSQDHILDLFRGFRFVLAMNVNETYAPTSLETPINFISEAKAIATRIMNYVVQVKTIHPTSGHDAWEHCNSTPYTVNWCIQHPVNHQIPSLGGNCMGLSYPLAMAAQKITGNSYIQYPIKIAGLFLGQNGACVGPLGSTTSIIPTMASFWGSLENYAGLYLPPITGPVAKEQVCFNFGFVNKCYQVSGSKESELGMLDSLVVQYVNTCLYLEAATLSGTWSHQHVNQISSNYHYYNYDLEYAILNGSSALGTQAHYQGVLNTAPCGGPYNHNYPVLDLGANTWDGHWYTSNRWAHPDIPGACNPTTDNENRGDFPGLDYMFLYNMYRYYYGSQIGSGYGDNSCSCTGNSVIAYHTTSGALSVSTTVPRKFSTYKNIGVYIKEYITQDLDIPSGITLTNKTDLIICNNSTVNVLNGGHFVNDLAALADDSVRITVRKGCTLHIASRGLLNIGSNTRLYIEEGAKLVIEPGSNLTIQDKGSVYVNYGSTFDLQIITGQTTWIRLEGPQSLLKVEAYYGNSLAPNSTLKFSPSSTMQQGGGLAQFVSGDLIHYVNSKLVVDDCRLLFDYIYPGQGENAQLVQMTYRYVAGADLQLPNHGILDLRGDLYLKRFFNSFPNFTFTWPGTTTQHGYIRFSRQGWWGGSNVPHIIADPGSTITLNGLNRTDTTLSVAQETVYILDPNIAKTTLNKGMVIFKEQGARLEITTPYDVVKTTFRGFYAGIPERGLEVYFNPVSGSLTDCDFVSLGTGLSLPLIFYNASFQISGCRFYNCGNGISVWGGGIQANSCSFYGYHVIGQYYPGNTYPGLRKGIYGINARGLTQNSTVTNCIAYTQALASINSSPISTIFSKCTVLDAGIDNNAYLRQALDLYQSNVSLSCCTFKNVSNAYANMDHTGSTTADAMYTPYAVVEVFNNGLLDMSNSYHGGNNNFTKNGSANVYLRDALIPRLNNGYNNLMADYVDLNTCYVANGNYSYYNGNFLTASGCPWDIFGSILMPLGTCNQSGSIIYPVNAFNNYWRKQQFLFNGNKQQGLDGMCLVNATCHNTNDVTLQFLDPNEHSAPYPNPACQNPNPQLAGGGEKILDNCTNCTVINTPAMGSARTHEVANAAASKMDRTLANGYKDAVNMFYQLHKAVNLNPTSGDLEVYELSRRKMHEAYNSALNVGQLQAGNPACNYLQMVTEVLDTVINSVPDTAGPNYARKFYGHMEKGETFRLARLYNQSLAEFNNALNIAKAKDRDYVQRWICMAQAEQQVFSGQLNHSEFQPQVDACSPPVILAGTPNGRSANNQPKIIDETIDASHIDESFANNFSVYPNPASNEINIRYAVDETNDARFEIMDVNGKIVGVYELTANEHMKAIKLDLIPGIYMYRLVTKSAISKTDKLVIIKQ